MYVSKDGTNAVGGLTNTAASWINRALLHLPRTARGHLVAVLGEFTGTIFFLFFAFAGTQVANIASNPNTGETVITTAPQKTPQQLLYISLAFGFSLAVNAWVYFRISGGLFNPAVTVGMVLIGAITVFRGILLFITQIVAAIVAAAIVNALFTGGLNVSTTLNATTSVAQGTVIEMLLTAQLVFTIFMLAAEKHTGTFIAPVGIGLSLFIAELTGVFWTGGSLNPARSFGPAVVVRKFEGYHWIYWVGPLAGTGLAVIMYKLIKALEYESANADPEAVLPPVNGAVAPVVNNDTSNSRVDSGHMTDGANGYYVPPANTVQMANGPNGYTNATNGHYVNGQAVQNGRNY